MSAITQIDSELQGIDQQIAKLDAGLVECTTELEHLAAADLSAVDSLDELTSRLTSLTQWHGAVLETDRALVDIEQQMAATLPESVVTDLSTVEGTFAQTKTLRSWYSAISGIDTELAGIDQAISAAESDVKEASDDLVGLIDEIGVCPTCEQQMHAEVLVS